MDQNLKHRRSLGKCRVLNRSISTSSITNFSFRIINYRLKQICGAYPPVKHIIDRSSLTRPDPTSILIGVSVKTFHEPKAAHDPHSLMVNTSHPSILFWREFRKKWLVCAHPFTDCIRNWHTSTPMLNKKFPSVTPKMVCAWIGLHM